MNSAQLFQVIFYSFIGGFISLLGGFLLISRKSLADKLAKYTTPFAAGALLAAVFLDLIPDGAEESELSTVLNGALVGIVLFFFLERAFSWFHHHHEHPDSENHNQKRGKNLPLIIVGNGMHNALDGVAIAASFLINVETGIITTIAVAAHEIPHEISDFGLMLARGMSRGRVLLTNVLIAISTVLVAAIVFSIGKTDNFPTGFLLGLSAGFLLYIAMSDIIPTIHENMEQRKKILDWQPVLLVVGVLAIAAAVHIAKNIESKTPEPSKNSNSSQHCKSLTSVSKNASSHVEICNSSD